MLHLREKNFLLGQSSLRDETKKWCMDMKYRESGMPDEQLWKTFFDPDQILEQMGIGRNINTLIDVGCGYGTFLIPAAKRISGQAIGIDIDPEMIEACRTKALKQNLENVALVCGDMSAANRAESLERHTETVDYITLFNILHCEKPLALLRSAYNLLNSKGRAGVIHWKYGDTPRGPSLEIRPTPEKISEWAEEAGFSLLDSFDLPPYHFGLVFEKK